MRLSLLALLAATAVQAEEPKELYDAKQFLTQIASCASVALDVNSCLISSSIVVMIEHDDTSNAGASENHRVLSTNEDNCGKPEFDTATIEYLVNEAASSCTNIETEAVQEAIGAFSAIFSNNQCWVAVCDQTSGDDDDGIGMDDDWNDPFIGGETMDIVSIVIDQAMACPGVSIDRESCLAINALGFLEGSDVDLHSSIEGGSRRRLIHTTGMCIPPEVSEEEVRVILGMAESACNEAGIDVTPAEVDQTVSSVMTAFSGDCWDTVCHALTAESLVFVLDGIAECSGEPLDKSSCVAETAIKMFADKGATFDFTSLDLELCSFQHNEYQDVLKVVESAANVCVAEGQQTRQQEIEKITSHLSIMFDSGSCWTDTCPEQPHEEDNYNDGNDDNNGVDSFFQRLVMDHMTQCANVTFDGSTCLDLTLEEMLLGGGGGPLGDGSDNDFSGGATAASSIAPVRRHLQQFANKKGLSSSSTSSNGGGSGGTSEFGNEENYYTSNDETEEEEMCEVPEVDATSIEFRVNMAKVSCLANGYEVSDSSVQAAIDNYTALFGAKVCWESICHEETVMMLMAKYMQDCADIELPFANPDDTTADDMVLGCMVDYTMSTDYTEFGLLEPNEDSIDHCYPPGHDDIKNTCPTSIAPAALKHCTTGGPPDFPPEMSMSYGYDAFDWGWGEDIFFEDGFGFSMSMSYGYGDSGDSKDDDKPPKFDPDRDARLMENLCIILEKLSSDKGKQCLLPLCGEGDYNAFEDSISPSTMPSAAPSTELSTSPSSLPSSLPSAEPSMQPSSAPSLPPTSNVTNGIVEIRYEAAIKVDNLDISAIPVTPGEELNKIVDVLKEVLRQFLPDNSEARILSIGGIPIATTNGSRLRRYRLLQADAGVEIEFEVISTLVCDDAECSDADAISQELYAATTQDIAKSVSDGTLTTAIQEKASEADVPVLASIEINSFEAEEPTIEITEGDEGSPGSKVGVASLTLVAGLVGFVLCAV